MRLDQALAARNADLSRRKARELIAAGRVLLNDRPVKVASREVSERDRIVILEDVPELSILRETPDWVAVNKPAGMPTQPVRTRDRRSLEELLRVRYGTIYVVHRIDTHTSGVVVFARTREAAARLSQLFASRAVRKTYLAVVEGVVEREQTIDSAIEGKSAITIIRPRKALGDRTLIEADILTGRTHQIRIHMQSIGHPVAGDRRYGATQSAPRMLLHAWKLAHAELGEIVAPVPADFP
ncbi:MAG TPA: RluA family pseudouridine synthase [Thermoanaerobaculia bacterium]|jgi:RluA family pseudouridine synthase